MQFFISCPFLKKNDPIFEKLIETLDKKKIKKKVFFSQFFSENFNDRILQGIRKSDFFVLIWSDATKSDKMVQNELSIFNKYNSQNVNKIVIRIDKTPIKKIDKPIFSDFIENGTIYEINETNVVEKTNKIIALDPSDFFKQINLLKKLVVQYKKKLPKNNPIKILEKLEELKFFVSQRYKILATNTIQRDVSNYIISFLENNSEKFLLISGDYGSGKSTLCRHIFHQLCLDGGKTYIPLFIPLGELNKQENLKHDLIPHIVKFIKNNYKLDVTTDVFRNLVNTGKLIFIFDALDEMSNRLDFTTTNKNLEKIKKLSEKSRVILTSRTTLITDEIKTQIISETNSIQILDFDEKDIDDFLEKKHSKNRNRIIVKEILEEKQVNDLSHKPIFLSLISDNFDKIDEGRIFSNSSSIFRFLTYEWIRHDVDKNYAFSSERKREQIKDFRERCSEILAMAQYRNRKLLSVKDIETKIKNEFKNEIKNITKLLQDYSNDAKYCTFLAREDKNTFRFILKSIMEYFVARRIVREIHHNKRKEFFEDTEGRLSIEILNFIKKIIQAEQTINSETLFELKKKIKNKSIEKILEKKENKTRNLMNFIQNEKLLKIGNAVTILQLLDSLPRNFDFSNKHIEKIFLKNSNLDKCNFKSAHASNAIIHNSSMKNSELDNADFSFSTMLNVEIQNGSLKHANLKNCTLEGINLDSAHLEHCNLDDSTFSHVILEEAFLDHANLKNIKSKLLFAKNTSLMNANLENASMVDANLSGANLENASMVDANLSGANLENCIISSTNLNGANLTKSNMKNAILDEVRLINSQLIESNLENTSMRKAVLSKSNLTLANFDRSELLYSNFSEAKFFKTRLAESNLQYSNLEFTNITECELENANLSNAKLTNARLLGVNLSGVNLSDARLENVIMIRVRLDNAILSNTKLTDSKLEEIKMERANFSKISLKNTEIIQGVMREVDFDDAEMMNTKLINADLEGCNFRKADLTDADLTNANLSGADLRKSVLIRTKLNNSNLEKTSFWESNMLGAEFENSKMTRTNLWSANLSEAKLCNTMIENASFRETTLTKSTFANSRVCRTNLHSAILSQADFSNAIIENVNAEEAEIVQTNFKDSKIIKVNFWSSNLSKSILYKTTIDHTSFRESNLSNTNFQEAIISGANFQEAIISGANFENAKIIHTNFKDVTSIENVNFINTTMDEESYNSINNEKLKEILQSQNFKLIKT